jgi:tetratricopeptide (TPR) repeat protein
MHFTLYNIAFAEADTEAMQREWDWAKGTPNEHSALWQKAQGAAFFGKLRESRTLMKQASDTAERQGLREAAAAYRTTQASIEAAFGNVREARRWIEEALQMERQSVRRNVALTLSFIGDDRAAKALVDELLIQFPDDTALKNVLIPSVAAQSELHAGSTSKAIEIVSSTIPYERGNLGLTYANGLAYLRAKAGREAAVEFQKIVDQRGVTPSYPNHSLAHLGLGRAYALLGDVAKARKTYQDFLAIWKDADPDIPILIQAKQEYAKLAALNGS